MFAAFATAGRFLVVSGELRLFHLFDPLWSARNARFRLWLRYFFELCVMRLEFVHDAAADDVEGVLQASVYLDANVLRTRSQSSQ